jgi:hypothetical protein
MFCNPEYVYFPKRFYDFVYLVAIDICSLLVHI